MARRAPGQPRQKQKMTARTHQRILAFDIHPLHAGFAALEGPSHLLDFGTTRFKKDRVSPAGAAAYQMPRIVARSQPDRIVITMPANQTLAQDRLREVKHAILASARRAGIPVSEIPREKYLEVLGVRTRYSAALQMVARFPALGPRLPKRRKIWQAERPIMAAFDATAAGVAHLLRYRRQTPHRAAA